jgi:hypothetical protein
MQQEDHRVPLRIPDTKFGVWRKHHNFALAICAVLIFSYLHMSVLPEFSRRSDMLSFYQSNCNRTYGQAMASQWKASVAAQLNASAGFTSSIYAR